LAGSFRVDHNDLSLDNSIAEDFKYDASGLISNATTNSNTRSNIDVAAKPATNSLAKASLAAGAVAAAATATKAGASHSDHVTLDFEQSMSPQMFADSVNDTFSASDTFTAAEEYFDDSVVDDDLHATPESGRAGADVMVDMDHDRTQVLGEQDADLTGNATELLPQPVRSRDSDSSND